MSKALKKVEEKLMRESAKSVNDFFNEIFKQIENRFGNDVATKFYWDGKHGLEKNKPQGFDSKAHEREFDRHYKDFMQQFDRMKGYFEEAR